MNTQNQPTVLNGETIVLEAVIPLPALLQVHNVDPLQVGIAVAVNRKLVPRTMWAETQVQPGDAVEVVHARQGG